VVSEVALALVLLIGAGLMLRSFDRVLHVAPGFQSEHVLTLSTDLPAARYPRDEQRIGFYRDVLERLRTMPGVEAAAAVTYPPLAGGDLVYSFWIDGRPAAPDGVEPSANYYAVTSDYFRTLEIPLLRGRAFSEQDGRSGLGVAIVDDTFARRFLAGEDPIGKRIRIGNRNADPREIVGVVGPVTHYALEGGATPSIYEPHAQNATAEMTLVLRASSDPAALVGAAKAAFHAVDPMQPVASIRTMEEVLSDAVAPRRFPLVLIVVFAGVALVLALLGLSGVIAYTVSQRTHEIGVRLALGARRSDVVHMIVRQGARLVLVGIGTGVVASLLLTQLATKLLFGVSATDPATFAVVPLLLAGAALLASWLPARRAAKVDPMSALRAE
jgi:putative ABC transport system permease protein